MSRFYVIDENNNASYSERLDTAEVFKTERAAINRAKDLAKSEPGQPFYICKAISVVACGVSSPAISEVED